MKLIGRLTDEDVGEKVVEMNNPEIRIGARGIVLRDDGKMAVFYKTNKNEYKLPGGGLEGYETPEDAFKREVLEETGCQVKITKKLGVIEECKSINNFKQISHVFVSKVVRDTNKLNLTEKEKYEGSKLVWATPQEALKLIAESYDKLVESKYQSVYSTRFVILRDKKILETYFKDLKKDPKKLETDSWDR